jgi:hypothetical protein
VFLDVPLLLPSTAPCSGDLNPAVAVGAAMLELLVSPLDSLRC